MALRVLYKKLACGFVLSFAAMAYGAEMPYMDMLKPDMVFVNGAAGPAGRVKVKLSPCRCLRREVSVYVSGEGSVSKVELVWNVALPKDALIYGGDWERTYGTAGWYRMDDKAAPNEGWKPWYFLVNDGKRTDGYGLMVQPNAFGAWKVAPGSVTLSLDVRAGSHPLELKGRQWGLKACTIVDRRGDEKETPFEAAREFCRKMCPNPRLPKEPVYGYNDWYCAYGLNTATNFLADAEAFLACCKGLENRPFIVADDGWQTAPSDISVGPGLRWAGTNARWGMAMDEVARRVRAMGARPGLWYRPFLPDAGRAKGLPMDPTDPALPARIRADVARFVKWGFVLLKADFVTYDWSGKWGGSLAESPVSREFPEWHDRSRTTAEVVRGLYAAMREAAGDDMVIIGCNALDHFAAGLFELQRTGDDTSGREWGRTCLYGVNTLGQRMHHDRTFYALDGDCVGLVSAGDVPWGKNRQWLDLLARSGTALFVSWKRELMDDEVRAALTEACRRASQVQPVAEPLDWMRQTRPVRWRFGDVEKTYAW